MQQIFFPAITTTLLSAIVLLNYVLIRGQLPFLIFGYILVLNSIFVGSFFMVYNRGVKQMGLIFRSLILKKAKRHSKYSQLLLSGLSRISWKIGNMHNLDEETRLIAFRSIQDYTLTLLLSTS